MYIRRAEELKEWVEDPANYPKTPTTPKEYEISAGI